MIDVLHRYASILAALKPYTQVLMVGAVLWAGYVVISEATNIDTHLMLAVVVFIWSCTLYVMIVSFANVPALPSKELRWVTRFQIRIKRLGYHLLSYVFLLVSVAALYMAYNLLKIGMAALENP